MCVFVPLMLTAEKKCNTVINASVCVDSVRKNIHNYVVECVYLESDNKTFPCSHNKNNNNNNNNNASPLISRLTVARYYKLGYSLRPLFFTISEFMMTTIALLLALMTTYITTQVSSLSRNRRDSPGECYLML